MGAWVCTGVHFKLLYLFKGTRVDGWSHCVKYVALFAL